MRARVSRLLIGLLLRHCGTHGELFEPEPRDRSQVSHSGVNRGLGANRPPPPSRALVFGTVPMIVYKLPRSGSSWFVSVMIRRPGGSPLVAITTGRRAGEKRPRGPRSASYPGWLGILSAGRAATLEVYS